MQIMRPALRTKNHAGIGAPFKISLIVMSFMFHLSLCFSVFVIITTIASLLIFSGFASKIYNMKEKNIQKRILTLAEYRVEQGLTYEALGYMFGVSRDSPVNWVRAGYSVLLGDGAPKIIKIVAEGE